MPGRQSHGPLPASKPKSSKSNSNHRRKHRSLNAFAIAEKQVDTPPGIPRGRLGELDPRPSKRPRLDAENDEDGYGGEDFRAKRSKPQQSGHGHDRDVDVHSDSEGENWKTGEVGSEDDSDIDSDEAMGESDEERFEGFTFRGSSSGINMRKSRATTTRDEQAGGTFTDIDLDEDNVGNSDAEQSDGLGEDAVDLAEVLDQGSDEEEEDDMDGLEGAASDDHDAPSDAESEFSALGDSDDVDPEKLSSLRQLVSNLERSTVGGNKSRHQPSAYEAIPPSEFALPAKNKLTIADLLPTVTDPKLRRSLKVLSNNSTKPSSKRTGIPGKLDVPLPRRQQERLDRAAAYDKAKETLNRWVDTVKHNRRAEHLSFPLHDPNHSAPQGKDEMLPVVNSKSLNDLESTIQNILEESGLAPGTAKEEYEEFAELEANRPSLEEIQAQRADLRRARDLLFREEQRAKRIKKIKSKTYRKVHRRDRDRLALRGAEERGADGIEDSEEEKERNDRRRAEERMGARHRESRWAKAVKNSGRAKWDEDARTGIQEMARRGEELKRRVQGKDIEGDEDSSSDDSDDTSQGSDEGEDVGRRRLEKSLNAMVGDGNNTGKTNAYFKSSLHNMEFMRKADAAQKARNDEAIKDLKRTLAGESSSSEDEDDEGEETGRRTYGPTTTPKGQMSKPRQSRPKLEFEERESSNEEHDEIQHEETEKRKKFVPKVAAQKDSPSEDNPFRTRQSSISRQYMGIQTGPIFSEASTPKFTDKSNSLERGKMDEAGSHKVITTKTTAATAFASPASCFNAAPLTKIAPSPPPLELSDASDSEEEDVPRTPSNLTTTSKDIISRGFAGDNVELAFEAEKKALVEEEGPQTEDNTLPGWGRWAGPALSKKDKAFNHRSRFLTVTPGVVDAEKRKDRKLDKVIINERRQKKGAKYLAPQLPHPFETKGQYERSLRLPMGPEWGTKETFQGMTKPRVMVKQGVIKAMQKPLL